MRTAASLGFIRSLDFSLVMSLAMYVFLEHVCRTFIYSLTFSKVEGGGNRVFHGLSLWPALVEVVQQHSLQQEVHSVVKKGA